MRRVYVVGLLAGVGMVLVEVSKLDSLAGVLVAVYVGLGGWRLRLSLI